MKREIESIKNKMLAKYLHNKERYGRMLDLVADVTLYQHGKRWFGEESPYAVFHHIAYEVENCKEYRAVAQHLKEANVEWPAISGADDYISQFTIWIETGKKALIKLRPLVLDVAKDWTSERRNKDLEKPRIGHYFKGWYMQPATNQTPVQ